MNKYPISHQNIASAAMKFYRLTEITIGVKRMPYRH